MDDKKLKKQIKEELSNFPDEVLEEWVFGHYGRKWPPVDVSDCGPVFLSKSLEFWKKVKWGSQVVDIAGLDLSSSEDAIFAIYSNFVFDPEDPKSIFEDIKGERYIKILSYILEYGVCPGYICLLNEDGKYTIADGHHRIYALSQWGQTRYNLKMCGMVFSLQ